MFTNTTLGPTATNSVASNSATLTVDTLPAVTTSPTSKTVNAGATTTLHAAAAGNPTPTVQWYVSPLGVGGPFGILANAGPYSGARTGALTISGITPAMNGYAYRAYFTNDVGVGESQIATLTVHFAPAITQQPVNQATILNGKASFTAAASGNPTPNVQWYRSINGGYNYRALNNGGIYSGVTTDTLTITGATKGISTYLYRAVFTNAVGSVTSKAAVLKVSNGPQVTTQPSNEIVAAGGTTAFTAVAIGNPAPNVQWYFSNNSGNTWNLITNSSLYSGATTTTLTITGATQIMNGFEYKAVFSNSEGTTASDTATLAVI